MEYLRTQTGGDIDLAKMLLETALQEVPGARSRLSKAEQPCDVVSPAHLLKGMLGMLGAHRASQLSAEVEKAGRADDQRAIGDLRSSLDCELSRLLDVMHDVTAK